jgi:hypothetical protein
MLKIKRIPLCEEARTVDLPWFFLGDPKIGGLTGLGSKPNVLIMASNELVPQGLQTGEEE